MTSPPFWTAYTEAAVAFAYARIAELEEMLTAATDVAVQRGYRIDELERWQQVDLENYKRHLEAK